MERLEMVEKLKAKAGISYEEARNVLEESNWDLLNAMIILENRGNFQQTEQKEEKPMESTKKTFDKEAAESWFVKVGNWLKDLVDKGNRNHILVKKNGRQVMEIPLTVAVLLLILLHGFTMFVLFISLILGYRYAFRSDKENAMEKQQIKDASQAAEDINTRHTVNSFGESAV